MDNDGAIDRELDMLRKVLGYSGSRRKSFRDCFGSGGVYFAGLFISGLVCVFVKGELYGLSDVDRLNSLMIVIYTFLLGFIFMLLITSARSLYLSIPYGFRCKSRSCSKLSDSFKFYALVYFFCYLVIFLLCVLLSISGVVFIAVTLFLLIIFCMRLCKIYDELQFNKIIKELSLYVILAKPPFPVLSECDGMRNAEHNPATGLPMVGGVDVGGNPYGYNQHE